ncbi:MAG: hypothetical protein GY917_01185 [Planctomycetaceae bacterium]|nr:hypothetical protein [Planctomycetaceae bacterium]
MTTYPTRGGRPTVYYRALASLVCIHASLQFLIECDVNLTVTIHPHDGSSRNKTHPAKRFACPISRLPTGPVLIFRWRVVATYLECVKSIFGPAGTIVSAGTKVQKFYPSAVG